MLICGGVCGIDFYLCDVVVVLIFSEGGCLVFFIIIVVVNVYGVVFVWWVMVL